MIKINEIFHSIQFEGFNTGMPAIFIRFSGCNKTCNYCDTPHMKGKLYTSIGIIEEIKNYHCRNIVITGGEATIQYYEPLVKLLRELKYFVCIETNGTNDIDPELFDWVTMSPKSKNLNLKWCDECKVVWTGKEDLKWFEDNIITDRFYLQPCSLKNTDEVIKIVKTNPLWRISIQTQKLIGVR